MKLIPVLAIVLAISLPAPAQNPDRDSDLQRQMKQLEQSMQQLREQMLELRESLESLRFPPNSSDLFENNQSAYNDSLWQWLLDTAWKRNPFDSESFEKTLEEALRSLDSDKVNDYRQLENQKSDTPYYFHSQINGDTSRLRLGPMEIVVIERGADDVEIYMRNKNNEWRFDGKKGDDGNFDLKDRSDWDDNSSFDEDKQPRLKTKWFQLGIGFNNYVTPDMRFRLPEEYRAMEPLPGPSIGVHLHVVSQQLRIVHPVYLRYGIYGEFNSYKFGGSEILMPRTDSVQFYTSEQTLRKNKLSTDYIGVPLMLMLKAGPQQSDRHFTIGIGGYGSYLLGARTKIKTSAGEKSKMHDSFNLSPLRYGLTASLGYGDVSLFGTYSLSPLFQEELEPKLYPVTLGLHFAF
ncbi:MAG: porin family protein [Chitinophagales bacterium]|nr:PorT family protein [Chitinophagales bacterium]MDW8393468.1 porin family protein [Chitinophagales bacterium]